MVVGLNEVVVGFFNRTPVAKRSCIYRGRVDTERSARHSSEGISRLAEVLNLGGLYAICKRLLLATQQQKRRPEGRLM